MPDIEPGLCSGSPFSKMLLLSFGFRGLDYRDIEENCKKCVRDGLGSKDWRNETTFPLHLFLPSKSQPVSQSCLK